MDAASRRPDETTLGALLERFGNVGFGGPLVLLALPPMIPIPLVPSGVPAGLGMMWLGAELLRGAARPALPEAAKRLRVTRSGMMRAGTRVVRLFRWFGLRLRGRLSWAVAQRRLIGVSLVLNGLVILLPVPFGNQLPALGCAAYGLGLIRRDGVMILAGHALVAAGLAWNAVLVLLGIGAARALVG